MLVTILVVLVVLALVGGWGYAGRPGGYYAPGSLITVLVLILLVLFLTGRI